MVVSLAKAQRSTEASQEKRRDQPRRALLALELPHLKRVVIVGGDGAPAVRSYGHVVDPAGVAREGLQLAPLSSSHA
jgi:hypothetical protein